MFTELVAIINIFLIFYSIRQNRLRKKSEHDKKDLEQSNKELVNAAVDLEQSNKELVNAAVSLKNQKEKEFLFYQKEKLKFDEMSIDFQKQSLKMEEKNKVVADKIRSGEYEKDLFSMIKDIASEVPGFDEELAEDMYKVFKKHEHKFVEAGKEIGKKY